MPVIRGLAELAIERVLGIKTSHTVFNEHLYELAGFKTRIGSERSALIEAGKEPCDGDAIDLPAIDIELRGKEPFPPLNGMHPIHAQHVGKCLKLVYGQKTNW